MPQQMLQQIRFPFLFGGTFIEGFAQYDFSIFQNSNFPSFSEGLSLRVTKRGGVQLRRGDFPSFSEGLSLREEA